MKFFILRDFVAGLVVALLAIVSNSRCQADLVISVSDAMIKAGETTLIDVFVSNEAGGAIEADLAFSFTEYSFEILGGDGTSQLTFQAFTDLPDDPSFDYVNDPDYIFADGGGDPVYEGGISNSTLYFGFDTRIDAGDSLVPLGSTRLLTRLEVTHTLGPGQDANSFATTTFDLEPGTGATFENFSFNTIVTLTDLFHTGSVTVTAVPEPSIGIVLAIASGAWIARRRRDPSVTL